MQGGKAPGLLAAAGAANLFALGGFSSSDDDVSLAPVCAPHLDVSVKLFPRLFNAGCRPLRCFCSAETVQCPCAPPSDAPHKVWCVPASFVCVYRMKAALRTLAQTAAPSPSRRLTPWQAA